MLFKELSWSSVVMATEETKGWHICKHFKGKASVIAIQYD